MKEFNLQKAIEGAPLITRDGHKARLICHDRKDPKFNAVLVALILSGSGKRETIVQYNSAGFQVNYAKNYDLFLDD